MLLGTVSSTNTNTNPQTHSSPSYLTFGICTLLIIFFFFTTPATAQGAPDISPNAHVSIWYPTPQGPNDELISINVIDALLLSYESQWDNVNASMWCLVDEELGRYEERELNNPLQPTGNYLIPDLNTNINATTFPLPCHFDLRDTNDAADSFAAGTYLLVSTEGAAVTRSYSVSASDGGDASATPTLVSASASESDPAAGSSSRVSSPGATPTSTAGTTEASQRDDGDAEAKNDQSGISGAQIAGIVLGAVGAVASLAFLVYWIRLKIRSSRDGQNKDLPRGNDGTRSGERTPEGKQSESGWYRPELRQELPAQSVGGTA